MKKNIPKQISKFHGETKHWISESIIYTSHSVAIILCRNSDPLTKKNKDINFFKCKNTRYT